MMAEAYDGLARLRDWSDEGLDIRPVLVYEERAHLVEELFALTPLPLFVLAANGGLDSLKDLCVESFLARPLVVLEPHRLDADAGRALV